MHLPGKRFAESKSADVKAVGRWIGEIMALALRPSYRQRRLSDDQERIRRDLLRKALALKAYRGDNDRYPEKLSDLVPKYLGALPWDAATDREFCYTRDQNSNSIELRSWGANGRDDAGALDNDDQTVLLAKRSARDIRRAQECDQ